eukprot:CAMPEP_0169274326 /NCGR_PEP_ID=MMETSP1016-20121227/51657_1 /TAXON_ID=342587 /ORGANISM="Karlodinium micrum, Strain CCMP2283" /LENGTH=181 /DNA_ID=CAMNT_0009360863 /DNA_START=50 /DNA_END=592 /DNA_ORIENTATION=+
MGADVQKLLDPRAKCCCAEDGHDGQADVFDPNTIQHCHAEEVIGGFRQPRELEPGEGYTSSPSQNDAPCNGPFWRAPEQTPEVEIPHIGSNEFTVLLERTSKKTRLGITLDTSDGNLVVDKVDGGLVGAWNLANPQHIVRIGDKVVSINGWSADSVALTQMCDRHDSLEVTVLRIVFRRPP